MSYYVMSDIHGCYDDMMQMIEQIKLSDADTLIFAGDYIDRGPKSYEMLKWIESNPDNVIFLRGNHDEEFAYNVDLMYGILLQKECSEHSLDDTKLIYGLLWQLSLKQGNGVSFFDYYGTIRKLIDSHDVTLAELKRWADCIRKMPFFFRHEIQQKQFVAVHAGYIESIEGIDTDEHYDSLEDFYMYARDDAYIYGGLEHGVVVAGHTPTTLEDELPYNDGNVYKSYDEDMDCTFYDIDCGCASRERKSNAKLACIRLEDEKIFYV